MPNRNGDGHGYFTPPRKMPATKPFFDLVAGLDGYPVFTLAATP